MKIPASFRGPYVVARHEFLVNLKSVRLLIMLAVLALVVVGGAYGQSVGSRGESSQLTPVVVWGHLAILPAAERVAVVWVTDPFGGPLTDRTVFFVVHGDSGEEIIGEDQTDAEGFAWIPIGARTQIGATVRLGLAEFQYGFLLSDPMVNFTASFRVEDLDNDGLRDNVGIHVLTLAGAPAAASVYVNDALVTSTNALGYARARLPLGSSNVTIEVAGERETTTANAVREPARFSAGPDFVLLYTASIFVTFVVPAFAIVMAFDTISKERMQGTLDLLLSRPLSRSGALLGKFVGTFGVVAVPATIANVAGIGILTAVVGKGPTGSFAIAFFGLEFLLISLYVLLQLALSTVAKTSGTAILFGILAWLAFNVLYPVVTLVLSSGLFPNNFEAQFQFFQVAGLGNPSWIYQQLVAFAAPEPRGGAFPGTTLGLPVVAVAAGVWLVFLLLSALWAFRHKAAE